MANDGKGTRFQKAQTKTSIMRNLKIMACVYRNTKEMTRKAREERMANDGKDYDFCIVLKKFHSASPNRPTY